MMGGGGKTYRDEGGRNLFSVGGQLVRFCPPPPSFFAPPCLAFFGLPNEFLKQLVAKKCEVIANEFKQNTCRR